MNLFLARRLYQGYGNDKRKRASAPATRIATVGVAVGLAVMLLSACIVRGFQREVSRKVTGFAAHAELLDLGSFSSPENFPIVAGDSLLKALKNQPGIASAQRYSQKIGILKTEEDFQAISLKGVDSDYDMSFIGQHIVAGTLPSFARSADTTATTTRIVISQPTADALRLAAGDRVYAYFFEDAVKMRRFEIAAIYKTNLKQFDKTFAFTDKRTVDRLNGWDTAQVSGVELHVSDFGRLAETTAALREQLQGRTDSLGGTYSLLSVRENPRTEGVFHWLDLLDMNVWVILILLLCVAGFSMISGLLILILEQTNTIGLLKALGATNTRIRHIFLYYAALIIGRGLLLGDAIALSLLLLQQQTGLFKLNPETYYVSTVPVELSPAIILGLNIGTLAITMLALITPSFMISRIQPAKALRFD
ncbi:MAG: ABC transporter permease [Alloprevotella sp.]|nr:ABC transporter permease [Alloprevotella sp.]